MEVFSKRHCFFQGQLYEQKSGPPLSSPLSSVQIFSHKKGKMLLKYKEESTFKTSQIFFCNNKGNLEYFSQKNNHRENFHNLAHPVKLFKVHVVRFVYLN